MRWKEEREEGRRGEERVQEGIEQWREENGSGK